LNEVTPRPEITPLDRLGLTLCLAVIAHAIVILGVTFTGEGKPKPSYNTMEIVLVQQKSEKPKDAKLLAQANLKGGGETAKDVTPATPLPPPFPDNQANIATPAPASPPQNPPQPKAVDEKKPAAKHPPADTRQPLAVEKKQAKTRLSKQRNIKKQPQAAAKKQPEIKKKPKEPTAAQLLANSYKIASLSAEIDRKLQAKAKRPRRTFISASTQEYKYAAYMEAWRAKVERVGNLNYPQEAQRQGLSGSLILDVALNPDGSVKKIIVRRSSGYKVLDDAAIRIVKLASPFAPFPDDIRKETDILHITRTWQFLANSSFH
jgi:protein TonB